MAVHGGPPGTATVHHGTTFLHLLLAPGRPQGPGPPLRRLRTSSSTTAATSTPFTAPGWPVLMVVVLVENEVAVVMVAMVVVMV